MMHKFLVIIVFSVLATSTLSQTVSKDESELRSLIEKATTAQIDFDPMSLDKILTMDYIEISPLGEFDTRDKVLGFYAPAEKTKMEGMTAVVDPSEYSIRIYKDSAIVIARLDYTMTSQGKALPPRRIRATYVCRKEKSGWKIASAQYTGIRPPTPPKT